MSSVPLPRLHRREEGRVVAGVCSGIAAELGVDPTVVRLAFALLALASGSGVAAYLGAWALLPSPEAREAPDRLRFGAGVLLLILACFLALLVTHARRFRAPVVTRTSLYLPFTLRVALEHARSLHRAVTALPLRRGVLRL